MVKRVERKLRILVVDDMPAMRAVIRNMLEAIGSTDVSECEDAETAWHAIREADPAEGGFNLIISDWNLPGMSGVELLRAVRGAARTRHLPFLIVTAEGSPAHLSEAAEAEVSDYIVKPFNGDQLREKIAAILLRASPLPG